MARSLLCFGVEECDERGSGGWSLVVHVDSGISIIYIIDIAIDSGIGSGGGVRGRGEWARLSSGDPGGRVSAASAPADGDDAQVSAAHCTP